MSVFQNRRPKLNNGRRVDMHAVISQETMSALEEIGKGNRSAAIEYLVRVYLERGAQSEASEPTA
jgi:hypothetical protein